MSGILLRDQRVAALVTLLASPVVYPGTSYGIEVAPSSIISHGGEWTDQERARYFAKPPTVIVSCLGTSPTDYIEQAGGAVRPRYVMSCVVVARDIPTPGDGRLHRSDVAQAIAETIAASIYFDEIEAGGEITRFRMENAWASLRDNKDVGMWVMTWEEAGEIASVDPDTLPDLVTVRTEYEIADTIDAPQAIGNVTYPAPQIDDPDLP